MKIGIDISQLAYKGTGVANYLENLLDYILLENKNNSYLLFASTLRNRKVFEDLKKRYEGKGVEFKILPLPITVLEFLWNTLHILPIERVVGKCDIFITSDWTEPPSRNKKATIIYDMTVYKTPEEMDKKIVETQKRKLKHVKKESDLILTISEASKKDIAEILGFSKDKIKVVYPGV